MDADALAQEALDAAVAQEAVPFIPFDDELPQAGLAYLYTTDPRCCWGKARALIAKLQCPIDVADIQRRWGGGPYEVLVKDATGGRIVACKPFALAGPSKLRAIVDELEPRTDDGEGAFWEGVKRARGARSEDDRFARLEKAIADLAAPKASAASAMSDQLMLEWFRASMLKATTQQTSGPIGQTLKELIEAQSLLDGLRGETPKEDDGFMTMIGRSLPALLSLLGTAPPPPQLALPAAAEPARAALPAPAAASPATTAPASSPAPQRPRQAPDAAAAMRSAQARLAVLLEELVEAIEQDEDPESWGEWAASTLGAGLRQQIRADVNAVDSLLALADGLDIPTRELVQGPRGRALIAATVAEVKRRTDEEAAPPAAPAPEPAPS